MSADDLSSALIVAQLNAGLFKCAADDAELVKARARLATAQERVRASPDDRLLAQAASAAENNVNRLEHLLLQARSPEPIGGAPAPRAPRTQTEELDDILKRVDAVLSESETPAAKPITPEDMEAHAAKSRVTLDDLLGKIPPAAPAKPVVGKSGVFPPRPQIGGPTPQIPPLRGALPTPGPVSQPEMDDLVGALRTKLENAARIAPKHAPKPGLESNRPAMPAAAMSPEAQALAARLRPSSAPDLASVTRHALDTPRLPKAMGRMGAAQRALSWLTPAVGTGLGLAGLAGGAALAAPPLFHAATQPTVAPKPTEGTDPRWLLGGAAALTGLGIGGYMLNEHLKKKRTAAQKLDEDDEVAAA